MNMETNKLTRWVIDKIKTDFPDDVALLIGLKGHSVDGDRHGECFDYFIPATEKGNELSQTFIINGIGHDLYPRSWERTERTANLDDHATLCLGNAEILYSRSKEDEDRFMSLKNKLFENLKNKDFVYRKALEKLDIAMDLYRTMMFEDKLYKVRTAAGFIHYYLSMSVTYLNGTFSDDWRNGQIHELMSLEELPKNFIKYYESMLSANSIEELRTLAHLTISTTRNFIASYKPAADTEYSLNFSYLSDWYQELSLTWRRIRYYCKIKNIDAAFKDACNLQNELNIIKEEFGLQEMDLLGYYSFSNLDPLVKKANEIEEYIVKEIEGHGVKINKFDTLEDFLAQK